METSRARTGRPRELKVGHVGAADEKQAGDRAEKDEKQRPNAADQFFVNRHYRDTFVQQVIRIFLLEAARDGVHFPPAPAPVTRPVLSAPNHRDNCYRATGRGFSRWAEGMRRYTPGRGNPKLRVVIRRKAGWHHADDGMRFAVAFNVAADDVAIGSKTPLPKTFAQDDDVRVALLLVRRQKARVPENWRDPKNLEEAGRDRGQAEALRAIALGQVALATARCGHVREDVILRQPIEVVGRRDRMP